MEALRGKVAVVTGGSEGIGGAIVRRLAEAGMKVAALARRHEKLSELESELKRKGYIVKGYICDVQSESDVKAAFNSIEKDFGPVTVLINNAGVLRMMAFEDIVLESVHTMINTNLIGVIACIKEGLDSMKKHGVDHGHIVNINSVAGQRMLSMETVSIYSATKHALRVITENLRNELKPSKIRVTSISPGLVKTPMTSEFSSNLPESECLAPDNIADAVIYALSAPYNVNVSEIILDTTSTLRS